MRIEEKVNKILRVFNIVDTDIQHFKKKSGMQCLRICSHCCKNVHVTATVLELLPLAYWFYNKQTAQYWLEKLAAVPTVGESKCILLRFPKNSRNVGRCTAYKLRPLICRLFGFSVVFDKNNRPQLVTCTVIKKLFKETFLETSRSLETLHGPIMKRYYTMLYTIDFGLAQQFYPFNEALRKAIETVISHFTYRKLI